MLRSLKFTALVMGMIGAAHAMAAGPDLTVVSFGGANKAAQVKAFYAPWEAAGNGKIVAGEYNGEMAKVKAMVDTKSVSWDLVEVESPELSRGCDEDMFEQLDPKLFGKTEDLRQRRYPAVRRGLLRVVDRVGLQRRQTGFRANQLGGFLGHQEIPGQAWPA